MNTFALKHLLAFSFLSAVSLAHAEGGCPPGMIPHSGTDISSCGPIPPGYNQPKGHWMTQWGAFAQDDNGIAGLSSGRPTEDDAKQAAIDNCVARGGKQCVAEDTYRNGCIAIVSGTTPSGEGRGIVHTDRTYKDAIRNGIKACKSSGKTNCELFRSECSLAKWIDD